MKRLAVLYGFLIVVIVILADTRRLGFLYVVYDFPFGDKVGHFILFGLLSLVVNLGMIRIGSPSDPPVRTAPDTIRKVIKTSLILATFVGLEEISQRWFPSRTTDLFDFSASCLGIAFFAFIALKITTGRSLRN